MQRKIDKASNLKATAGGDMFRDWGGKWRAMQRSVLRGTSRRNQRGCPRPGARGRDGADGFDDNPARRRRHGAPVARIETFSGQRAREGYPSQ